MSAKGEIWNDIRIITHCWAQQLVIFLTDVNAIPEQYPNTSHMNKSDYKLHYFPSQTIQYYYH